MRLPQDYVNKNSRHSARRVQDVLSVKRFHINTDFFPEKSIFFKKFVGFSCLFPVSCDCIPIRSQRNKYLWSLRRATDLTEARDFCTVFNLSPCTSGVSVFPPARSVRALAPAEAHRGRAEERRQRHLLHQQPAEVGQAQAASQDPDFPFCI